MDLATIASIHTAVYYTLYNSNSNPINSQLSNTTHASVYLLPINHNSLPRYCRRSWQPLLRVFIVYRPRRNDHHECHKCSQQPDPYHEVDVLLDVADEEGGKLWRFVRVNLGSEGCSGKRTLTPVPMRTRVVMSSVFFWPLKSWLRISSGENK